MEFTELEFFPLAFKPVIDDFSTNPFVPKDPWELIESGNFNQVISYLSKRIGMSTFIQGKLADNQYSFYCSVFQRPVCVLLWSFGLKNILAAIKCTIWIIFFCLRTMGNFEVCLCGPPKVLLWTTLQVREILGPIKKFSKGLHFFNVINFIK